ncbi:patatin-like phospholipase family protein [Phreatobacter oligotrophus]|uniref:NTE family protein n=1 Tax=Phreatobacter oligotrophus TaxID=1122261 RepID=A0A2T4Z2N7_9HYPH|nr:patatin-like phospholipase family protein [Phreatobacter oligotrophus]PTM55046.1 NTE family protein [Phreatobacter oligotrophus]
MSDAKDSGIALCLSGGGYRAMVFHLGALVRLNEAGILQKLTLISSVSGGSITAAYLGMRWKELTFVDGRATNLDLILSSVRKMASTSIDVGAILGGIFLPGTISDRVAAAYDDALFHGATLANLPDAAKGKGPRFVINATNIQSGALWRFSRAFMGDYRVGLVKNPKVSLAVAVAASSAFPPFLSPVTLRVEDPYETVEGVDLATAPFREMVVLSDGGVYDNLGLETAWKGKGTLLVSDAGQKMSAESDPAHDWARHSLRVLDVVDNQVRSLRKRQLIDAYKIAADKEGHRPGAYWGVRSHFAKYKLATDPLGCAARNPEPLAGIPTRLEAMPEAVQDKLMNWGYAITDAALRAHISKPLQARLGVSVSPPNGFPCPGGY